MAGPDKPATNVVQGVCGREVVELLNCAASDKCDEGECVRLAAALRECAKKHHIKNFTAQVNAREGETGKPGA